MADQKLRISLRPIGLSLATNVSLESTPVCLLFFAVKIGQTVENTKSCFHTCNLRCLCMTMAAFGTVLANPHSFGCSSISSPIFLHHTGFTFTLSSPPLLKDGATYNLYSKLRARSPIRLLSVTPSLSNFFFSLFLLRRRKYMPTTPITTMIANDTLIELPRTKRGASSCW
jgi:hypothetical protein